MSSIDDQAKAYAAMERCYAALPASDAAKAFAAAAVSCLEMALQLDPAGGGATASAMLHVIMTASIERRPNAGAPVMQ